MNISSIQKLYFNDKELSSLFFNGELIWKTNDIVDYFEETIPENPGQSTYDYSLLQNFNDGFKIWWM